MGCIIVVGGQFGSEGKGKVINALCRQQAGEPYFVVRCGGANSGHTTEFDGKDIIVKQLPSAVHDDMATLCISAGCGVNLSILEEEIAKCRVPRERLIIDPRAMVITQADRDMEAGSIVGPIGSTGSGTGAASARRLMRSKDVTLIGDYFDRLNAIARIETVAPLLIDAMENAGPEIIVEGVQGFGLSLFHGDKYPFCTSRDTCASGFASEIGMPPSGVSRVIVTIRAFPIRVGGNSGPLFAETTWDEVARLSGAPEVEQEFTSVTNRLRRVGHFDVELVKKAVRYNGSEDLALMGVDRLDHKCRGVKNYNDLTSDVKDFISQVEEDTKAGVRFIGTGPRNEDLIEL